MIPNHTTNQSQPPLPQKLNVKHGNWASINKSFLALCLNKFGDCGTQIRTQLPIPLEPYATRPSKMDMDRHLVTGDIIPGRYTYERRQLTSEDLKLLERISPEAAEDFTDNLPLSDRGSRELTTATAVYMHSLKVRTDDDAECHEHFASLVSEDSNIATCNHRDYRDY